jgi:sulfonate transport system permease protein
MDRVIFEPVGERKTRSERSGARVARRSEPRHYALLSWVAPLTLLLVWELLSRLGLIQAIVLPPPSSVFLTAHKLFLTGELQANLQASLARAVLGFALGASVGLMLGVSVGLSGLLYALFDRSLQIIRAVPFLAVVPLVLVWLGIGEASKVFLIALGSLFPMYLNTTLGIRQVDPKLLEMCRLLGLGRVQLIRYVILPGALPSILNGVRLALTTSWLALVVAESFGATAGIGFLATNAREFLQTDVMVFVIVVYAIIGIVSDGLARKLEQRLLAWHPNYATSARAQRGQERS